MPGWDGYSIHGWFAERYGAPVLVEGIFSRSLALATRDLRIVPCQLGDRAGVMGAAILAIDRVLAPEAIDQGLRLT